MQAELIAVGTELLLGQITDTNATYLARLLASHGVDLLHKQTVGDNLERVRAAVVLALGRADLIMTSGGLGPTEDDLTVEAVGDRTIFMFPGVPHEMEGLVADGLVPWLRAHAGAEVIRSRVLRITGLG